MGGWSEDGEGAIATFNVLNVCCSIAAYNITNLAGRRKGKDFTGVQIPIVPECVRSIGGQ